VLLVLRDGQVQGFGPPAEVLAALNLSAQQSRQQTGSISPVKLASST